jgi:hypothetical protein
MGAPELVAEELSIMKKLSQQLPEKPLTLDLSAETPLIPAYCSGGGLQ